MLSPSRISLPDQIQIACSPPLAHFPNGLKQQHETNPSLLIYVERVNTLQIPKKGHCSRVYDMWALCPKW